MISVYIMLSVKYTRGQTNKQKLYLIMEPFQNLMWISLYSTLRIIWSLNTDTLRLHGKLHYVGKHEKNK